MAAVEFADVLQPHADDEPVRNPLNGRQGQHKRGVSPAVPVERSELAPTISAPTATDASTDQDAWQPPPQVGSWMMSENFTNALCEIHGLVSDGAAQGGLQCAMLPGFRTEIDEAIVARLDAYHGTANIEAFFHLPELLEDINCIIVESQANPESPAVAQQLLYIQIAIREVQTMLVSTMFDPAFTVQFGITADEVDVFTSKWEHFLTLLRQGVPMEGHVPSLIACTSKLVSGVLSRDTTRGTGLCLGGRVLDAMVTKARPTGDLEVAAHHGDVVQSMFERGPGAGPSQCTAQLPAVVESASDDEMDPTTGRCLNSGNESDGKDAFPRPRQNYREMCVPGSQSSQGQDAPLNPNGEPPVFDHDPVMRTPVQVTADISLKLVMLGVMTSCALAVGVFVLQVIPLLGVYDATGPSALATVRTVVPSAVFVTLNIVYFAASVAGDVTALIDVGLENELVRCARYPCLLLYIIALTPWVFFAYDLTDILDGEGDLRCGRITGPGRMVYTYFFMPWGMTLLGAHLQQGVPGAGMYIRRHIVIPLAMFVCFQLCMIVYSIVELPVAVTLSYVTALVVFGAVHYTCGLAVTPIAAIARGAHNGQREASLYRFLLLRTLRLWPMLDRGTLAPPAEDRPVRPEMQVLFSVPTLPDKLRLQEPRVMSSSVGVIIINPNRNVVFWNDRMASWTGTFAQSAIGQPLRRFIASSDEDPGYERFRELSHYGEQLDSISESVTFHWVSKNDDDAIGPNGQRVVSLEARLSRCVSDDSCGEKSDSGGYLALLVTEPTGTAKEANYRQDHHTNHLAQFNAGWENPFTTAAYCEWVVCVIGEQTKSSRLTHMYSTNYLTKFLSREDILREFSTYDYQTMMSKMFATYVSIAASKDVRLQFAEPESGSIPSDIFTCPVELDSLMSSLVTQAISRSAGSVLRLGVRFVPAKGRDKSGVDDYSGETKAVGRICLEIFEPHPNSATIVQALAQAGLFAQANALGGYLTTIDSHDTKETILSLVLPWFSSSTTASRASGLLQMIARETASNTTAAGGQDNDAPLVQKCQKDGVEAPEYPLAGCRCLIVDTNDHLIRPLTRTLWDRGMSVSARGSLVFGDDDAGGGNKEREEYNMIIVNIEEADVSLEQFFEEFKSSTAQIIIMSTLPTDGQLEELNAADGWYGLSLPLNRKDFDGILKKATDAIAKLKAEMKEIEDIRQAFIGNQSAPWERGKQLGSGSFGKVYEATNTLTGGKMACKIIPCSDSEQEQLSIFREVTLMASLSHRNIIHYFYCERGASDIRIFMELAEASLSGKIPKTGVSAVKAAGFLKDILLGLQYLHSRNIVHRDLKVPNVLVHNGICKLTDFGTAITVKPKDGAEGEKKEEHGISGTPHYMAPECLEGEDFDWSSDMWSVGCMLMEMVTGNPPWSHIGTGTWSVVRYVCKCYKEKLPLDYNQEKAGYHAAVMLFFQATIVLNARERQDCAALLQSPLICDLDEDTVRKQSIFCIANEKRKQSVHHKGKIQKSRIKANTKPNENEETDFAEQLMGDLGEPMEPEGADPDNQRRGTNFSGWGGSM